MIMDSDSFLAIVFLVVFGIPFFLVCSALVALIRWLWKKGND